MGDKISVIYHCEEGSWWAESPEFPALFAGGDTLDEARELVEAAVADEFGPDTNITSWMPPPFQLRQHITMNDSGGENVNPLLARLGSPLWSFADAPAASSSGRE